MIYILFAFSKRRSNYTPWERNLRQEDAEFHAVLIIMSPLDTVMQAFVIVMKTMNWIAYALQ